MMSQHDEYGDDETEHEWDEIDEAALARRMGDGLDVAADLFRLSRLLRDAAEADDVAKRRQMAVLLDGVAEMVEARDTRDIVMTAAFVLHKMTDSEASAALDVDELLSYVAERVMAGDDL